jgi:hypothetical protein
MGHARITTTMRYFEKNPDDIKKAAAQLQGAI